VTTSEGCPPKPWRRWALLPTTPASRPVSTLPDHAPRATDGMPLERSRSASDDERRMPTDLSTDVSTEALAKVEATDGMPLERSRSASDDERRMPTDLSPTCPPKPWRRWKLRMAGPQNARRAPATRMTRRRFPEGGQRPPEPHSFGANGTPTESRHPQNSRSRTIRGPGTILAAAFFVKHVYLIRSLSDPNQRYVGVTSNLEERFRTHNAGGSPHTSKYTPWELVTYVCFQDDERALQFERYLKSGSGRAFANKRLW